MTDHEHLPEHATAQRDERDAALAAIARRDWRAAIHAARAALEQPGAQDDVDVLRALAQAATELDYFTEALAANARIRAVTPETDLAARMALLGERRRLREARLWHEILRDNDAEPADIAEATEGAEAWDRLSIRYVPYWEMERFDEALDVVRAITADARANVAQWCLRARLVRLARPGAAGEAELRECVAAAHRLAPGDAAVAVITSELVRPPAPVEGLAPWMEELGFALRQAQGVEVVYPPVCQVAAGTSEMGSDPHVDAGSYPDEYPQHAQELGAYAIGRYPVTVAEYARFLAQTERRPPVRWLVQLNRPETPVTQVTWHDAVAYAAWLAEQTGEAWRLPSEAEWEKAARWDAARGRSHIYPWGDEFDPARANTLVTPARMLSGVGAFPAGASPCGALDMAGNVWEWTSSRYAPYPSVVGVTRESNDPTADRVTRGGARTHLPWLARAACRGHRTPGDYSDSVGFRLVRGAGDGS